MLYLINNKPYVKVSNYYKEVKVEKKGNEYSIKPIGKRETRIYNADPKSVTEISVSQFYEKQNKSSEGRGSNKDLNSLDNLKNIE